MITSALTLSHRCPRLFQLAFVRAISFLGALLPIAGTAEVTSTLETFGFDSSRDGVAQCLDAMVWTPERNSQFEQWLLELDSDHYRVREQATFFLMQLPSLPHQRLRDAAEASETSIEKKRRIYQVLNHNTPLRLELLLYLAANSISTNKYSGLATRLVLAANAVPVTQRSVWDAVRTAMQHAVLPEDASALESFLSLEEATARVLACEGLVKVAGADAVPSILPLLKDEDPRARFHAAMAVKSLGSRACVPAFISLLDVVLPANYQRIDTHIRFYSIEMLKKLTGQNFGYRAGYTSEVRKKYIDQWKAWFKENGADATLQFKNAATTWRPEFFHPT